MVHFGGDGSAATHGPMYMCTTDSFMRVQHTPDISIPMNSGLRLGFLPYMNINRKADKYF